MAEINPLTISSMYVKSLNISPLLKTFNLNELTDCSICMVEIIAPAKISQLACNENHFFHENCLDAWMSSNKANRRAPTCPMCRVPIVESKIEKKMFKGIEAKGPAYNGP